MRLGLLLILFFVAAFASAQTNSPASQPQAPSLNLMPLPAKAELGAGQMPLTEAFTVTLEGYKEPRLERAIDRMKQLLFRQTGIPFIYGTADATKPGLVIHTEHASEKIQKLGEDESYRLEVTPTGARLTAPNPLGVLRGIETFLQLVAPVPASAADAKAAAAMREAYALPVVTIDDKPRFPWRGMLLDSCRHFMPLEVVKRTLDGMAAVKMNVLHWHLSEYQGFRVESKKFPKLQGMGSDGQYYTQAEIKDVIDYARDRGIRVIPEFDMPGHATSWFVGYPELAAGPGPYEITREWGVFDPAMDVTKESTYKFLDKFIGEMAALFPDQYFHIGGDEVNGKQWDANPQIQQFMRAHNLKDNAALQAYFNGRLQKIVAKHKKTMVGWDEILHPDLPKETVVQSWRGQKSLAEAARQGYRGILSSGYYLDLVKHADFYYSSDPLSNETASLSPDEQARVLGGESCMWAEWISPETIDSRVWPANAAIAEKLWSPANASDVDSMYQRLESESLRLEALGLTHRSNYQRMLERIAGPEYANDLRLLADAVEPVKGYDRGHLDPEKTQRLPLNRLVDAARPESMVARDFNAAVDRIVAGTASQQDEALVHDLLAKWRDNHARLTPDFARSPYMAELEPLSNELSQLAVAALAQIDAQSVASQQSSGTADLLAQAKKPSASVIIAVLPGLTKLLQPPTSAPSR